MISTYYVDASSSSGPVAMLDFLALDNSSHRLHVYSHFDHCAKENIFQRRLRTTGDSCGFINYHFMSTLYLLCYVGGCLLPFQIAGMLMSFHDDFPCQFLSFCRIILIW